MCCLHLLAQHELNLFVGMAVFHSSLESWINLANLSLILRSCDTSDDCRLSNASVPSRYPRVKFLLAALRMICNLFSRVSYRIFLIDNFDSILDLIRPLFSSSASKESLFLLLMVVAFQYCPMHCFRYGFLRFCMLIIDIFGICDPGAIRFASISILINYTIIFCDDQMLSNSNAQSGKIQLLSITTDALQSVQGSS